MRMPEHFQTGPKKHRLFYLVNNVFVTSTFFGQFMTKKWLEQLQAVFFGDTFRRKWVNILEKIKDGFVRDYNYSLRTCGIGTLKLRRNPPRN